MPCSGPTSHPRSMASSDPVSNPISNPHEKHARPAPLDDPDAIDDLGEQIAVLAAHIHAATHRLLLLIAEFDRRRGWEASGHRSCAHWLAFRTGTDMGAAREKVRAAKALEDLPLTGRAMARGELSFSQVRALTRVATLDSEEELLDVARSCTTAQLETFIRAWRHLGRAAEADLERERHRSRTFSVFPDEGGMYLVRGRVTPEVGAVLMRAVEAAGDALFRSEARGETTSRQRRADAVGLVAEQALAAGFGQTAGKGTVGQEGDERQAGLGRVVPSLSGTRAERYQVVLHVDHATLSGGDDRGAERSGQPDHSHLDDGTRVSAETSRRLSCDASVVEVRRERDRSVLDERSVIGKGSVPGKGSTLDTGSVPGKGSTLDTGSVLDVGRRTRTVPPALRRALEIRDRGCRFPGCGLRFTEAHHVKHWADGGATKLENLILLCRFHHRKLHEDGYTVQSAGEDQPVFFTPEGRPLMDRPSRPELPDEPAGALIEQNDVRGIRPHGWSCTPRFRNQWEIPYEVHAEAFEALEAGAVPLKSPGAGARSRAST